MVAAAALIAVALQNLGTRFSVREALVAVVQLTELVTTARITVAMVVAAVRQHTTIPQLKTVVGVVAVLLPLGFIATRAQNDQKRFPHSAYTMNK